MASKVRHILLVVLVIVATADYAMANEEPKENCQTTCELMHMQCTDINPLQSEDICHCYDPIEKTSLEIESL